MAKIDIYDAEKAFIKIESKDGFISLESLFEKDKYLVSLLSVSEDEISAIREEALKEINEAKVDRNKYRHLRTELFVREKSRYQRYVENALKRYQETRDMYYLKSYQIYLEELREQKFKNYDNFWDEWVSNSSEKIAYYKQIASICSDSEIFKSAVKAEIKVNRLEIKKQLDF